MKGLWGALLLLAGAQMSLSVGRVPQAVRVSVNTSQWIHLTNDKFLSLSVPPTFLLNNNYSDATKNMLRGLSPAYLRVGGTGSDKLYFDSPINVPDECCVTMRQWKALQELVEDSGVELIFTVNPSPRRPTSNDWDPSDILKLLQLSDEQNITQSSYWQLGYVPSSNDGLTLGQDVARLRKVLDLLPRYKSVAVLGPDLPSCVSPDCLRYLKNFLLQAGDIISALLFQIKCERDEKEEKVALERISRVIIDVDTKMSSRNALESNLSKAIPKKQLWITETGVDEYTGGFTDALVWALRLGHSAKLGYDVILRHLSNLSEPSPDYWVSLLFHQLVGNAVLDAYPASHSSVTVFAHCTAPSYKPGAVTVWGVNAAEDVVSLILPDTGVLIYSLTAGLRQGSTLLNGKELRLIHGASLPELHPRELSEGPVFIPAYSVFYIVLPYLEAPACNTYIKPDSPSNLQVSRITRNSNTYSSLTDYNNGVAIGNFSRSSIEYIGHPGASQRRNDTKLNLMERSTIKNQDNVKEMTFETTSQSLSNNDEDLISMLTKKKVSSTKDPNSRDSGIENKMFGLFNYLRFKRSEFKNGPISVFDTTEPASLHLRSISKPTITPLNSFKKLQHIYEVMSDEHFKKSQKDFLLPKDSTHQDNYNNDNKEPSNLYYFPGEFYNKLRTLIKLQNVIEPHGEIQEISEVAGVDSSTLQVTGKPFSNLTINMKMVEQTTEMMEYYYKCANKFFNKASYGSSKHTGKMIHCVEPGKTTEITPSQFELKEEESLNHSMKDKGISNNKSSQLIKNTKNDAHIATFYNRMKREISKDIQPYETTLSNSTKLLLVEQNLKDRLEEGEHYTLFLEELADEGEQLLKSFDQNYRTNNMKDKFYSGANLSDQDKNIRNGILADSSVMKNLFNNKMRKENTELSTNTVLSSSSQTKFDSNTENEDRPEKNKSLSFNSSSFLVPDLIQDVNKSDLVLDVNNNHPKIKNENNTHTKIKKYNKISQQNKQFSASSTMNPLNYVTNNNKSGTSIQSQVEGNNSLRPVVLSYEHYNKNYSQDSTMLNNEQRVDYNRKNHYVLTQPYQTSTSLIINKIDKNNSVVKESLSTNKSLTQRKLNNHPNIDTSPIVRLQQTKVRPAFGGSSIFKTGSSESNPLKMTLSSLRKLRLEALRVRLEKARERILHLATSNSNNKKRVSKRATTYPSSILDIISAAYNSNLSKYDEDLMKTDFKRSNEDSLKYPKENIFDKLQPFKTEVVDQSRSDNNDESIEILSKSENMFNKLEYDHADSKNSEGTNTSSLNKLIDVGSVFHRIFRVKPRETTSLQHSCVQDRFNDFEAEGQDKLQLSKSLQPLNKQLEIKALQNYLKTNQHTDSNKSETNNSSDKPEFQLTQNYVKRLKRSIGSNIQMNNYELKKLLTNKIGEEGPLKEISDVDDSSSETLIRSVLSSNAKKMYGIDRMLKLARQYKKTSPNSLEISNNEGNIDNSTKGIFENGNKNKEMEALNSKDLKLTRNVFNKNISHLLGVTVTKNNVLMTMPDNFLSQIPDKNLQEANNTDELKNNYISNFVNEVQKYFKMITSVITRLIKT